MQVDRNDLMAVLRYINTIVVSLDRIGSSDVGERESEHLLAEFVDQWLVFGMLAKARSLLSNPFSEEVGDDGMDELEREMEGVPYWSFSHRDPPPELLAELSQVASSDEDQH